jgi:hypothetical protein
MTKLNIIILILFQKKELKWHVNSKAVQVENQD